MSAEGIELPKLTGQDDGKTLAGLFSAAEFSAHAKQFYLVLLNEGPADASVSVSAPATRPISGDLILFDRDRRPFFATTVRLLAPNNAR